MALIFVTLILSTVIAFLVTSYSKILATLPSLPDFKQKLAHILGSADTYKAVWTSLSTFFLNYVLPVIRVISNALTNLALHLFHDLRTIIRSIPSTIQTIQLNQDGEGVDGVASRLWTLVSTTSISYAQQAVAALGPLNPVYGPQKLRADVWEDEVNNLITNEIEVPGIVKTDIDISISDGKLVVLTKRETPDRGPVYQIQDRAYGEFEFKVKLPAGTKGGDLKVGLSNGVLTISYPRLSVNATERIKIE